MVGDFVRDKDAVTATLLACEIAAMQNKWKFFLSRIIKIYTKHNFYKEHLIAIVKKGMDGAEQIRQMMVDIRENPLTELMAQKLNIYSIIKLQSRKI